MEKKYIKKLLENLCCSDCGADFDNYKILRQEKNILVLNFVCPKCGKDFGTCLLHINEKNLRSKKAVPLELQDGPDLITADEVIDAHNLIKNLQSVDKINEL